MTKASRPSFNKLRKKAEKTLEKNRAGDSRALPGQDVQSLTHELSVHQIELEMQNEELQRDQRELEAAREKYFDLYNLAPVAYLTFNDKGLVAEANLTAFSLLGVDRAYLINKSFSAFIDQASQDIFYHHRREVFRTGGKLTCELVLKRKDGTLFPAEIQSIALLAGERPVMRTILIDITGRKQAEKTQTSLNEKEVLLKEIHHRVKNNLQIVSSLLSLQAKRTAHPEAVSALLQSRDRISSISHIHEKLSHSSNLASVDMGAYTRSLVSDLRGSYGGENSSVRLTVNAQDFSLSITEAIPVGLIINELVSNALRHAFPNETKGEITIQLRPRGAAQFSLIVRDNGIGFPEEVDFRNPPSLGLTLVNSLVTQLRGTIELDRTDGTTLTITFG